MTEEGIVTKINKEFVNVKVERHSACGSCGLCGLTDSVKYAEFYIKNTCGAEKGDRVVIEIKKANSSKFAFAAYLLPLAAGLLLFFAALLFKLPEWAWIVAFFIGLASAFAALALLDKHKKHKWMESPEMLSIIVKNTEPEGGNENDN